MNRLYFEKFVRVNFACLDEEVLKFCFVKKSELSDTTVSGTTCLIPLYWLSYYFITWNGETPKWSSILWKSNHSSNVIQKILFIICYFLIYLIVRYFSNRMLCIVCPFIRLFVCLYTFHILPLCQFQSNRHKALLCKENLSLFKRRAMPFLKRERNSLLT